MIRLCVTGPPGTMTAQLKGISWARRTFYEKEAVAAEKRRIIQNLLLFDGTTFIPMKSKFPTPFDGPIHLSVKYVFPLTAEEAKKYIAHLANPAFELYHTVEPDFDNVVKTLVDTLTSVGCWVNDARICDANIHKRRGTTPRIVINFENMPPLP